MPAERTRQRLFFALWPPRDAVARMQRLAATLDDCGRPVAPESLHVTLAFHGSCNAPRRDALAALAERVTLPPMTLVFDRLGGFRRSRITWLGMAEPPAALLALASTLRGEDAEPRRFVPHITLRRKSAPPARRAIEPICWRARNFALVESGADGVAGAYRDLARWSLQV